MAPAALALAFAHARRALGAPRATVELLALVLYGFALERAVILVFASHTYGDAWSLAPFGVPVAVAAVWAAVILSAMALAARLGFVSPLARGSAAAALGIALDLLIEPVAVRAGLWQWTPPGEWMGVPVGNFVGWAVIVGAYTAGAERTSDRERLVAGVARRAALAAASIGALLAVGSLWTRARAESVFAGASGWATWVGLLGLAGSLAARGAGVGRSSTPLVALGVGGSSAPLVVLGVGGSATLAGRLAAARGSFPCLVFALIASVFAADALSLADVRLVVVALGTGLALGCILRRAQSPR